MNLTGLSIIGSDKKNISSSTFYATNPALGTPITDIAFEQGGTEQVDQAVSLAYTAFYQYKKISPARRAAFLEAIADEIMALDAALISRYMLESGLPEARALGERGRTCGQLKLFASVLRAGDWLDVRIDTAMPERTPLPRVDLRKTKVALGPVAVFGSSNFPLAFSAAGGDTASALAAGCSVVVKGHPAHPGVSELVAHAVLKAARTTGMPEGVFTLLQGTSHELGQHLVSHPKIKAVGFTGSLKAGRVLFDLAAARPEPIPVYAEMGSTNPVFILPEAAQTRTQNIAQGLAGSITLGVGQFCTNPGLVLAIKDTHTQEIGQQVAQLISQSPTGTMLTNTIYNAYNQGIKSLSELSGVSLIGQSDKSGEGFAAKPAFLQTSARQLLSNAQIGHEIFGPSSVFVLCETEQEIYQVAQNLEGHLTATVQGTDNDLQKYAPLLDILADKVGRLVINGYPTGVEVCQAMVHGGPYPATTDSRTSSVGASAIDRFARPICYQDFPEFLLPKELKNQNTLGIWRLINGEKTQKSI